MAADPLSPTGAADLSSGSVASFGTFRASLPRGKHERGRGRGESRAGEKGRNAASNESNEKGEGKGKGMEKAGMGLMEGAKGGKEKGMGRDRLEASFQEEEEEEEDVDVDGVEAVDASVLWQRRFRQSARAGLGVGVGGDANDVDVVEVGDVTGALWADGGIGKLTHAQLLDLLRAKFGRLAHELDAAAAARLAPRPAAHNDQDDEDDDDGQSQEGWGRDHDKENDLSVEVGRIAHAPSAFVPWTEHTPGKRAVLAELAADPTAAMDAAALLQDVWGRPSLPSAADVGEHDSGFRSFAAQDADAVFGTGPAEPLSPWLGADPAQPVSPWLLGAGAANDGGIAPSPFFSGRSGQLGSLNGQSTPSQQPQFSSPPGRAAPASADASTLAVDAFALAAADTSTAMLTSSEIPAALGSGLADLRIRAGLAALLGSVSETTSSALGPRIVASPAALDWQGTAAPELQALTLRLDAAEHVRRLRLTIVSEAALPAFAFAVVANGGRASTHTLWTDVTMARTSPVCTVQVAALRIGAAGATGDVDEAAAATRHAFIVVAEGGRELLRVPLRMFAGTGRVLVLAGSRQSLTFVPSAAATVGAGGFAPQTIVCANAGTRIVTVRLTAQTEAPVDAASWLTLAPRQVTLAPGAAEAITATLAVPAYALAATIAEQLHVSIVAADTELRARVFDRHGGPPTPPVFTKQYERAILSQSVQVHRLPVAVAWPGKAAAPAASSSLLDLRWCLSAAELPIEAAPPVTRSLYIINAADAPLAFTVAAEGDGVAVMPASTTVPAYHARRVVVTVDGPLSAGSRVLVQPADGGPTRIVALVPAAAKPQPRTEGPAWAASITVVPARIQPDQARHRVQVVNRSDVALTVQAAVAGAAARNYRAPSQIMELAPRRFVAFSVRRKAASVVPGGTASLDLHIAAAGMPQEHVAWSVPLGGTE